MISKGDVKFHPSVSYVAAKTAARIIFKCENREKDANFKEKLKEYWRGVIDLWRHFHYKATPMDEIIFIADPLWVVIGNVCLQYAAEKKLKKTL